MIKRGAMNENPQNEEAPNPGGEPPVVDLIGSETEERAAAQSSGQQDQQSQRRGNEPSEHGSHHSDRGDIDHEPEEDGCNHGRCDYCRNNFRRMYEALKEQRRDIVRIDQGCEAWVSVTNARIEREVEGMKEGMREVGDMSEIRNEMEKIKV